MVETEAVDEIADPAAEQQPEPDEQPEPRAFSARLVEVPSLAATALASSRAASSNDPVALLRRSRTSGRVRSRGFRIAFRAGVVPGTNAGILITVSPSMRSADGAAGIQVARTMSSVRWRGFPSRTTAR